MASITLERYELEQIVSETALRSAQLASQKTLELAGMACPFLSLREAGRVYGAKRVQRWIKKGAVNPVHEGGNATARVVVSELIQAAIGEEAFQFYKR
ncbi:MAG: hypothetical protein NC048_09885 [Bacteroides sp.]|nr:hypothetical protein [Bacteroides sp.]MCM1555783.1 hypothetical protein [Bacteroides sp.]